MRKAIIGGRISYLRPGQANASLSIYCAWHGCKICKPVHRGIPSDAAIVKWLLDGEKLPRGKSAAQQGPHRRMFPTADS